MPAVFISRPPRRSNTAAPPKRKPLSSSLSTLLNNCGSIIASVRSKLEKERDDLIDKAKQILKQPGRSGASDPKAEATFFQVALEHQHDFHDRHCLDEEDEH